MLPPVLLKANQVYTLLMRSIIDLVLNFRNFSETFYSVFFLLFLTLLILGIVNLYLKRKALGWIFIKYAAVTFFVFIIGVWGFVAFVSQSMGIGVGGDIMIPSAPASARSLGGYEYSNTTAGVIRDTREFNKIGYTSSLKTRKVEDISKKVTALIHASGGRIDIKSVSDQYANFVFVVPKSNFESFENDISALVDSKLYTKYITEQNLLSQKQSIESQQKDNATQISDVQAKKKAWLDQHNELIAEYNSTIIESKKRLAEVNFKLSMATNSSEMATLRTQQSNYNDLIKGFNLNIYNENLNYKNTAPQYDVQLSNLTKQKSDLSTQTSDFVDNVETVDGRITINYVTVWELMNIYSPVSPSIIITIVVLAALSYAIRKAVKSYSPVANNGEVLVERPYYLWYVGLVIILFLVSILVGSINSSRACCGGEIMIPGTPANVRTY